MSKIKYKAVFYDQDEEKYGYSSLEKFLQRNEARILAKKRPVGRPIKDRRKTGRKIGNRYAIVDPSNYQIVRFFDSMGQLENYLGMGNLHSRLYNYTRYKVSATASPLIKGFIVTTWRDNETLGLDRDDLEEMIYGKIKGWMIATQFERIRENIGNIDSVTLDKLFKYLQKVEHIDSRKLLEDEES